MKKFLSFFVLFFQYFLCYSQHFNWVQQYSTLQSHMLRADKSGHIYVIGNNMPNADFDPGPGFYTTAGTGMYLHKLDSLGNLIWARSFTGGYCFVDGMDISGDTAIAICGAMTGTVDFDPGAGVYNLTFTGVNGNDPFVVKVDSAGNFAWARKIGSAYNDETASSVCFDNAGNVLFTGRTGDSTDYDPGTGSYYMDNGLYNSNVFVEKLDAGGNFLWARRLDGYHGFGIECDEFNDVYSVGRFDNFVSDFDPGNGVYTMVGDTAAIYVWKLDTAGNFVWARQYGNMYTSPTFSGHCFDIDGLGNLFITGVFTQMADFDPDPLATNYLNSSDGHGYILKLRPNGELGWVRQLHVSPEAVAVDGNNDCYTVGNFKNQQDLDPGSGVYNLATDGSFDMYALKLNGAGGFEWARSFSNPSQFLDMYSISVDMNKNVYVVGDFKDSTDFDPDAGSRILYPSQYLENTFYLKLSEHETVSVGSIGRNEGIDIYPNPTRGRFSVSIGNETGSEFSIFVYDVTGRKVEERQITERQGIYHFDLSQKAAGLYFVEVISTFGREVLCEKFELLK